MSPIAQYKEMQAQSLHSQTIAELANSHTPRQPKLMAQWVKENGKLVCKWHIIDTLN